MDKLDENNKIDLYLLGKLDEAKRKSFEHKLQTDSELAKKVKEQKQAMDLLGVVHDMKMKQEVQEVQEQFQKTNPPRVIFHWLKPLMAVASVLILLVTSYWLFNGQTNEQLFDKHYTAYNTGFGDRDATDPTKVKLAEATLFYKQKEFKKALPLLESAAQNENDSKIQMMIGISYMEIQEYDKAIKIFEELSNVKDPAFQYHGLWYAALGHLKSDRIDQCKTLLARLINATDSTEIFKQKEAKELLKKIKK